MPLCPLCKSLWARRKNGACPGCGAPIKLRDGRWYSIHESSDNIRLLKYWEKLVGKRIGERFRLPRKSSRFKREAKFAQDLLVEIEQTAAEGEDTVDVALRAIWILFNDKDYTWKIFTSLMSMHNDWLVVVFMARQYIKKEKQQEKRERELHEEMQEMEDIWT